MKYKIWSIFGFIIFVWFINAGVLIIRVPLVMENLEICLQACRSHGN